jgi:putative restriction endonuclease
MTLDTYARAFAKLHTNVNRTGWSQTLGHRAPHKPLLLLAVIDLYAQGSTQSNLIELSPELGELFRLYWGRVMPPEQRGGLVLPFFHLRSDGFWHLAPKPGKEEVLAAIRDAGSIGQLRELLLGAFLDQELHLLLCAEEPRNTLRAVLIQTYFPPSTWPVLTQQGMINLKALYYSQRLLEHRQLLREEPSGGSEYQLAARGQGFRRAVTIAYDHRCALCGVRMLTADGHTVVDAAHIVPWSVSHNDDPRNGMALCRLCHWTFDEGLMSVSARYSIIISLETAATPNIPGHLQALSDRPMIGPLEQSLWPELDSLSWHRHHVFRNC